MFSQYKVQKALRQIIDIAKKAEQSCFPTREVLHPRGTSSPCRSMMLRVEMKLEDGSRFDYCLSMDPSNTHIARGKENDSQSQFAPQFLTITGMIRDISCRKYPEVAASGQEGKTDGGVVGSGEEEHAPVRSGAGNSADGDH